MTTTINDLADEFTENGLEDIADYIREHGVEATRHWLDGYLAGITSPQAAIDGDPEGWRLGNLEVARDQLPLRGNA